jgi:hypothetical protein
MHMKSSIFDFILISYAKLAIQSFFIGIVWFWHGSLGQCWAFVIADWQLLCGNFLVTADDNYSTNKAHLLIFRKFFFFLLNLFPGDDEYLVYFPSDSSRSWMLSAVTRWQNISVCLGIEFELLNFGVLEGAWLSKFWDYWVLTF